MLSMFILANLCFTISSSAIKDSCFLEAILNNVRFTFHMLMELNQPFCLQVVSSHLIKSQLVPLMFSFQLGTTWRAYHFWKHLSKNSLAVLLTLRSKGCNLSVQLKGIKTTLTMLVSSSFSSFSVHCPLKLSKSNKAGWLGESSAFSLHQQDMAKWF